MASIRKAGRASPERANNEMMGDNSGALQVKRPVCRQVFIKYAVFDPALVNSHKANVQNYIARGVAPGGQGWGLRTARRSAVPSSGEIFTPVSSS